MIVVNFKFFPFVICDFFCLCMYILLHSLISLLVRLKRKLRVCLPRVENWLLFGKTQICSWLPPSLRFGPSPRVAFLRVFYRAVSASLGRTGRKLNRISPVGKIDCERGLDGRERYSDSIAAGGCREAGRGAEEKRGDRISSQDFIGWIIQLRCF